MKAMSDIALTITRTTTGSRLVAIVAVLAATAMLPAQSTHTVPGQFATIQDAINASVDGDTVLVSPGIYFGGIDFIGRAITVRSTSGPEDTVINALQSGRAVVFQNFEAHASVLDGFTLTGGRAPDGALSQPGGDGGGILCQNASPFILNCIIHGNRAGDGGNEGVPSSIFGAATPPGRGGHGGGIACFSSVAVIANCFIYDNESGGGGTSFCPFIADGSPGRGGGIYDGDAVLFGQVNSLPLVIANCTIVDNRVPVYPWWPDMSWGAGIGVSNQILTIGGSAEVYNCIIRGNAPDNLDIYGVSTITHCNLEGGVGYTAVSSDLIDAPSLFVDPGSRNYRLRRGSPEIDAGQGLVTHLLSVDFEGDPRLIGASADIGADETCLIGSGEDLVLATRVNGTGNPNTSIRDVAPGDVLTMTCLSPHGDFHSEPTAIAIQAYSAGNPPVGVPAFPEVQLTPTGALVVEQTTALLPVGITIAGTVPTGLGGTILRVQAFASTPSAANAIFAATDAHEIVFP